MKNGVYQIRNLKNGKRYIGSAAQERGFTQRWREHKSRLNRNTHVSPILQRAWNKHGTETFVFEILLCCDPQNCLMYEQIALDHFKPEYNTCKVAGSSLGRKASTATKEKMSKSRKGKLTGEKNPMYGRRGDKNPMFGKRGKDCSHYGKKRSEEFKASVRGEKHGRAKLNSQQVFEIKRLGEAGISQRKRASMFGISKTQVARIDHKETWSHTLCPSISLVR